MTQKKIAVEVGIKEVAKTMTKTMPVGYQFVSWFPCWMGLGFTRFNPDKTDMAYIYAWNFWFGFWELRKWSTLKIE